MNGSLNYYDILGVSETATDEEIKKAYRELIKKWHPDKNSSKDATYMSQKINEAKEILLDKRKRFAFDQELKQERDAAFEEFTNRNKNRKEESKKTDTSQTPKYDQYETVSKWKYLHLWLRFSDANFFRKIVGLMGVALETFVCEIIDLILMIISYLLRIFSMFMEKIGNFVLGFFLFGIGLYFFGCILAGYNEYEVSKDFWMAIQVFWEEIVDTFDLMRGDESVIGILLIIAVCLSVAFALEWFVSHALSEKTFTFIRVKLNMILFKKCVGYDYYNAL